jgi:hypothetical protein
MKVTHLNFALAGVWLLTSILAAQEFIQPINLNVDINLRSPLALGFSLTEGTYTIGNNGDFADLQSALDVLKSDGIQGNVILELVDGIYETEEGNFFSLDGPIPGAGPEAGVIIRPAISRDIIIQGNGNYLIYFRNTSFVTLDGLSSNGTGSLTLNSICKDCWPAAPIIFDCNSDYNTVQNLTVINESYVTGWGICFGISNPFMGSPDFNVIQNNKIKKAGVAVLIQGYYSTGSFIRANGNIVRGNQIGTPYDSLIAWGVQVQYSKNTIIDKNEIQNINYYNMQNNPAINIFDSNDCIIRNNTVHNISGGGSLGTRGIVLSGAIGGTNNMVYNNMIFDIKGSKDNNCGKISGIQIKYQTNPKIYNNSVYLSGTCSNTSKSAALWIDYICNNTDIRNNILVNMREEIYGAAQSLFVQSGSSFNSDNNDLCIKPNQSNCLVTSDDIRYKTLTEWQLTNNDLNSICELPLFASPDLHLNLNFATSLDNGGVPIAEVETDIDGQLRDLSSPDIGADEIEIITSTVNEVNGQQFGFLLHQNYPNPFNHSTLIKYSIPERSEVEIAVYDITGSEINVVINEEKSAGTHEIIWSSNNLPGGVYFYRIRAGNLTAVKKMLIVK